MTSEILAPDVAWEPSGHLSEIALTAMVDGEDGLLDTAMHEHITSCETCAVQLGEVALRSAHVGEALTRIARPTWRASDPGPGDPGAGQRDPGACPGQRQTLDPAGAAPEAQGARGPDRGRARRRGARRDAVDAVDAGRGGANAHRGAQGSPVVRPALAAGDRAGVERSDRPIGAARLEPRAGACRRGVRDREEGFGTGLWWTEDGDEVPRWSGAALLLCGDLRRGFGAVARGAREREACGQLARG